MVTFVKKSWYIFALILLSFLITWSLFLPGYFPHHDDLQVMRILEMRKCLEDGQIPCRWVPDMGFGYGFPLFNFYGVLPYVIGAVLSYPLGFIGAAKALFFIPLFFGGFTMFFLLKELFNKNLPAFLGAVLYLLAPYRAVDAYVRGAVSESFAITLVPLLFLFGLRLVRFKGINNLIYTSVILAVFLLCHNIMTLFFIPLFIIWLGFFIWIEKKFPFKYLLFSFLLGGGMSAFFVLPAYLEKDLVHIDTLTQVNLDFRIHFASFGQLFLDRSWGYGPSQSGVMDGMSFQIGLPHWWIGFLAIFFAIFGFLKLNFLSNLRQTVDEKSYFLVFLMGSVFIFSLFMIHNKSAFVWESFRNLQFAQFPWRFLSVSIFANAILASIFITFLKSKLQLVATIVIVLLALLLNWNYFKVEKFYFDMNDQKKLSGDIWATQQKAAIWDYLPKSAKEPPQDIAEGKYHVLTPNSAVINDIQYGTDWIKMDVRILDHTILRFNQFYFPDWKVFINGKQSSFEYQDNSLGLMSLILGKGDYQIEARLIDTPIRLVANIISLFSLIVLLLLITIQVPRIKKYLSYYVKSLG